MVRPDGFEPPTPWFEARYSIQLSYGRNAPDFTGTCRFALHLIHGTGLPVDFRSANRYAKLSNGSAAPTVHTPVQPKRE